MQYIIYKLQNKINGKIYIGKTKRTLSVRMKDHRNTDCCRYLHRALKKYGENSFSKEIIYETESEDDVCVKELEFILKFNSLVPNGYNLVLDTNQGRTFHKKTLELMSKNTQGTYRTEKKWSKYLGVRTRKNSNLYSTRVTKDQTTYIHYYNDEMDAAEAYDKMVLYLYGLNSRLNFPKKLQEYRKINLKDFFVEFCKKQNTSSKFTGVSKAINCNNSPWRAYIYKDKKQICLGFYKTEQEAYEARKKYIEENGLTAKTKSKPA